MNASNPTYLHHYLLFNAFKYPSFLFLPLNHFKWTYFGVFVCCVKNISADVPNCENDKTFTSQRHTQCEFGVVYFLLNQQVFISDFYSYCVSWCSLIIKITVHVVPNIKTLWLKEAADTAYILFIMHIKY